MKIKFLVIILLFSVQLGGCQVLNKANIKLNINYINDYLVDSVTYSIFSFNIENICSDKLLIWFDKNDLRNFNYARKIRSYFLNRRKGDFTLLELINENLLKDNIPVIYETFLKELDINEKFTVLIFLKGKFDKSETEVCNLFIEKNTAIIPVKEINRFVNSEKLKKFFYKGQSLVLDFETLPSIRW